MNKDLRENNRDEQSTNPKYRFSQVISWVTFILYACTLICFLNSDTRNAENTNTIVGILSTLITILIGWQIYSTLSIKDIVSKETRNGLSSIKEDIEFDARAFVFLPLYEVGISLFESKETRIQGVKILFRAIEASNTIHLNYSKDFEDKYYQAMSFLKRDYCDRRENNELITVSDQEKLILERIAQRTSDTQLIDYVAKYFATAVKNTNI